MWPFALFAVMAMSQLSACFKKHFGNENALLHQRACVEAIEAKDYERANTHCELCLEYESSMPECLNGLGLIAIAHHDHEKAHNFFTKAIRQNNDFSQARNNLGVIYFSKGDFLSALKYFDRALEIDPSNTDARYNAGLSHFRLAQAQRAKEKIANSLEHFHLAKQQINKLVTLEPTYFHGFHDLGLIELNLYDLTEFVAERNEKLKAAKQAFSQCLAISAEEDGCYEGLGQVFFEGGQYDQSFANYFLCLTHAPQNVACRTGIVKAYEKNAHAEGGFAKLSEDIKQNRNSALAHEAFCFALFERGLDSQALKECEIALRLKPDLCNVHFRLAEYFSILLNTERTVKHCQAFLACGNKVSSKEIKRCQEILALVQR